jgi:integrase
MVLRWKDKPEQARFIKRGFSKVWMEHQPGEPGFDAEHHGLLAGVASKTLAMPTRRPLIGHIDEAYSSVGQLARDYFAARVFQSKHRRTQADRRRYVEQLLQVVVPDECDERPVAHWAIDKLGVRRLGLVLDKCPKPVRPLTDNGTDRYRDQHLWALRAMYNWGIETGWQAVPDEEETTLKFNPAAHVKPISRNGEGWHVWTVDEFEKFITKHPPGTMAYLCLMLLLFTVVRRSDVVRLGKPMVKDGSFKFHETKGREDTLKPRTIELRDELRAIIDAMPRDEQGRTAWERSTFLISATGKPYSVNALSHDFKRWAKEAGIPHCSPHGVRKFVANSAGDQGQSDLVVAGLLGHTTTKNVGPYTGKVKKDRLFEQGIASVLGLAQTTRAPKRVDLKLAKAA